METENFFVLFGRDGDGPDVAGPYSEQQCKSFIAKLWPGTARTARIVTAVEAAPHVARHRERWG